MNALNVFLKECRTEAGFTQEHTANYLGVTRNTSFFESEQYGSGRHLLPGIEAKIAPPGLDRIKSKAKVYLQITPKGQRFIEWYEKNGKILRGLD